MIPLEMVVRDKLVHRAPKMAIAQRNDPIEAFLFDRSNESLGVRIRLSLRLHRSGPVSHKPFASRTPSIRCMGVHFD